MDTNASRPREEAKQFPWSDLTEQQKRVAAGVHELVQALAAMPHSSESEDSKRSRERSTDLDAVLPQIHAERPNNVVLIDGGRGSGKTSVMLTLLDAWSASFRASEGAKNARPG